MASGAARASASRWPGAREGSSQGLTFGGRTAALFPGPRRTPRWARRSPLSGLPAGTADLTVPAGTRPPQPTPPAAQGAPGSRFWVPEAVRAGGRDFRALRRRDAPTAFAAASGAGGRGAPAGQRFGPPGGGAASRATFLPPSPHVASSRRGVRTKAGAEREGQPEVWRCVAAPSRTSAAPSPDSQATEDVMDGASAVSWETTRMRPMPRDYDGARIHEDLIEPPNQCLKDCPE
ncbi:translation initiation factor IF-2-like [Canis lupus familiaris]|uniref:translation initiation factor IF-2-like n=1 Tax=Canis lupus familiaris TaxID=9615 RepID=UPI0018F7DD36|nr:translation initiation factor IF-2-like [Canis lupus familiaris]